MSIRRNILFIFILASFSAKAQEDIAILDEYENGKKKYVMATRNDTNIFRSYYETGKLKYECYNENTDTFYIKIGKPVIDSVESLVRSCTQYTNWNEQGLKTEQGELFRGEVHGWVKFFNREGKVIRENHYKRGQLLERKEHQ